VVPHRLVDADADEPAKQQVELPAAIFRVRSRIEASRVACYLSGYGCAVRVAQIRRTALSDDVCPDGSSASSAQKRRLASIRRHVISGAVRHMHIDEVRPPRSKPVFDG
jgi:hypothetical protein